MFAPESNPSRVSVRGAGLALALVALFAPGCGPSADRLYPVAGEVTLDGRPLEAGSVTFTPDASKGNSGQEIAVGVIDNGKYELTTGRRRGAPPGAYKVSVVSTNFSGKDPPPKGATAAAPKSNIPLHYGDAGASPLRKEVVENPAEGAYNLELSGK